MVQSGAEASHDYREPIMRCPRYDAMSSSTIPKPIGILGGRLDPNLQGSKLQVIEASQGMTLDKVTGLENLSEEEGERDSEFVWSS